jgi:hypothetical protein
MPPGLTGVSPDLVSGATVLGTPVGSADSVTL